MSRWAGWVVAAVLLVLGGAAPAWAPAWAQVGSDRYSSIVLDAATGDVLSAANPDDARFPASLTKMMTLYMVFEALRDRRIALGQDVPVSLHAASAEPSKLGLLPTTRITVEQAVLGLVTKSANDAASALGELLGGQEERFGQMMTLRARALGMSHSVFRNASGLPDPEQVSTARDMALLARHLIQDFPNEYRYFSTPSFVFHGRTIYGHDGLLKNYPGADGLKTGYTVASGFNLVTSAVRGEVRLIGVVMGAAHAGERDLHMEALLDRGFEQLDVPVAPRHEPAVRGLVAAAAPAPTVRAAAATLVVAEPRARAPRWTLQLGSFATEGAARGAVGAARRVADLGEARGEARVDATGRRGHLVWRAELAGVSAADAREACAALARRRLACTPVRAEQVAFR